MIRSHLIYIFESEYTAADADFNLEPIAVIELTVVSGAPWGLERMDCKIRFKCLENIAASLFLR